MSEAKSIWTKMDEYKDERNYLCEAELERRYRDLLNDSYGVVEICGYSYESGDVLQEVDPTAFRCDLADWLSAEVSEEMLFEDEDGDIYEII